MAEVEGVDFVTLLVSDLAASLEFYKIKVGLTESDEKRPNAYAFSMKPVSMAIRHAPGRQRTEKPGDGILVWLKTLDAPSLHSELKRRGVPIVEDLHDSPFGMTFSFRDPDGYVLGVHDGG